jgi:DNA-binding transcriptional MerR regulator
LLNKLENKDNIEKIKKLYKQKSELNKEYKKLLSKENLDNSETNRKQELFLKISSIEKNIQNIQKNIFTGFLIQDSPLA